jgi:hypothetical protein
MDEHDRIHSDNTRDRSRNDVLLDSDELGERWNIGHRQVGWIAQHKGLTTSKSRYGKYHIDDILAFESKHGTKNFHRKF